MGAGNRRSAACTGGRLTPGERLRLRGLRSAPILGSDSLQGDPPGPPVRRRPARTPAGAHPPEDPDQGQAIALSLKLSVITPSLNQGAFIERTIRSVLDQGYENLEYLVVDGGSTDQTVGVIERYSDRIDWWVSEADAGQTDAIDKGLERATGDVIAYINSDDYYLPGAFATALGALERSGASWVAGAAINVDPRGAGEPGTRVTNGARSRPRHSRERRAGAIGGSSGTGPSPAGSLLAPGAVRPPWRIPPRPAVRPRRRVHGAAGPGR